MELALWHSPWPILFPVHAMAGSHGALCRSGVNESASRRLDRGHSIRRCGSRADRGSITPLFCSTLVAQLTPRPRFAPLAGADVCEGGAAYCVVLIHHVCRGRSNCGMRNAECGAAVCSQNIGNTRWSLRSEQRSLREKELPACELRRIWPVASSRVGYGD